LPLAAEGRETRLPRLDIIAPLVMVLELQQQLLLVLVLLPPPESLQVSLPSLLSSSNEISSSVLRRLSASKLRPSATLWRLS